MAEYKKGSLPQVEEFAFGPGADQVFNKEKLYYVEIDNTTGFQIQVKSIQSGNVKIAAGKKIVWPGYPSYPFKLNFTLSFGPGHIAGDKIIVTYMICYGNCSE